MAKINIAVIYGSTREGRFCDIVAKWVASQIESERMRELFDLDLIDPAEMDLPKRHERKQNDGLSVLRERLGRADAFVIVTPEYNHGYPASLKFLIDSVGEQWHAKPVAFVSYGGVSGGLRAVEQLRLVFAELHAVTMRDAVSFAHAWEQFDGTGTLREPGRAQRSMTIMLSFLHWWAVALREARNATPYRQLTAA